MLMRYEMFFNARSKADVSLIFHRETTVKKWKTGKSKKTDMLRSIRYDTRCYFNVGLKGGMSQLNLTERNQQLKSVKQKS